MVETDTVSIAVQLSWFASTVLFIVALHQLSSPVRARRGIWFAGAAMAIVIASVVFHPSLNANGGLILIAIIIGGTFSALHARRVDIAQMPQMIAFYNSLGGLSAAAVATLVLLNVPNYTVAAQSLAMLSALVGCVAFSGSMLAFMRLKGWFSRHEGFAKRQVPYLASGALVMLLGLILATSAEAHPVLLLAFVLLALSFGILMTLPTAAADMPVLISFYNALTGLAVAFDGFVLNNPAMVVAGVIVFAAGSLLTRLMARAVNRRLSEIMYSGLGILSEDPGLARRDHVNTIDARDAAMELAFARRVEIVPGYGMAVSQAQHKLRELTQMLEERGVETGFAIHPVAGRMPGHMNILLAEAGVSYDNIHDLADINTEFVEVDVVLVVGANDIINPAAHDDNDSPLWGMPILDVGKAKRVIVLKRGNGTGYAGVGNRLLFASISRVLFGDAKSSIQELILSIKSLN